MSEERLSIDWELWLIEHLLFTAKRDDLADVLVQQGLSAEQARDQVAAIEHSEGMTRLRARLSEARLALRLQSLHERLHTRDIAVYETLDPDTLRERHWIPSRPAKLTHVARDIPAVRDWSFATLAERFGEAVVPVNIRREEAACASETEKVLVGMPFAEFARRCVEEPGNAAYIVSRCGLLAQPEFRAAWDDLVDMPPLLAPLTPPRGVSLWVGPAGTMTPAHFDPHNVLLVQVQGRKRIRLAPRVRAHQHALLDGYYLDVPMDQAFGDDVLEVELGPGEALFIPVAWFHQVQALDPSITLSFLNFPWPNHFHGIGPTGSDDRRD
ncbi:MAG: hypothetical protein EP330_04980 [Deltaproteobacteria bacterium]|nr:MAG: hypothetical protein EP330_04980 [Deltaproteobacteria bacterium]